MRLRVFVVDSYYAPVTGLVHTDVATAGFRTITSEGVVSATSAINLTSTAAPTSAVALGQWVEIGDGLYGVDVASGSHPAPGGRIEAVVTVATRTVHAERHLIDDTVNSVNTAVTAMRGTDNDTLKILSDQLDAAITTLAGVFDDADVATVVDAIISRIETDLDGGDLSIQAIAGRVRVELADELGKIIALESRLSATRSLLLDEIEKIPRSPTALASGASVRRLNLFNSRVLDEVIQGETP